MKISELLLEVGDKPYPMKSRWAGSGDYFQKTSFLPNGKHLSIDFHLENRMALLNFYVDGSQQITGGGDALRIFSTVGNELNDFVRKRKPLVVAFTSYSEDPSRVKLYDRITQRILAQSPALKGYYDITNFKNEWPDELDMFMDDVQGLGNQKIYVLVHPKYQDYYTLGDDY